MRLVMREVWLSCVLAAASSFGCSEKAATSPPSPPAAPAQVPAEPSAPAAQPAAAAPTPAPTVTPDESGVVHITSNDQMRFSAGRINVKAGQAITIELKNEGKLPKEAMGHNLVVLKPGLDPMSFAMKAVAAKATDYIPADAGDQIIAHTKLLGPGESDTIKFDAPAPGTYPFVCTFPGHAAIMNGVLVVE
jgi:azurin